MLRTLRSKRVLGMALWQWALVLLLAAFAVWRQPPSGGPGLYVRWFLIAVGVSYVIVIIPLTAFRLTFSRD